MLRRALVTSGTESTIHVTIWDKKLLTTLTNGKTYQFHNLKTDFYEHLLLMTYPGTIVMPISEEIVPVPGHIALIRSEMLEKQQENVHTVLIQSIDLSLATSKNQCKACNYIGVFAQEGFPRCPSCKKRQPFKAMKTVRNGHIDIVLNETVYNLSIDVNLIEKVFGVERNENQSNVDYLELLELYVLQLEKVKIYFEGEIVTVFQKCG